MNVSPDPIWYVFLGNDPHWISDRGVESLAARVRQGYAAGARRFYLDRWMGGDGGPFVTAAAYLTVDKARRDAVGELINAVAGGSLGEPCEFLAFVGSGMHAADSLRGWSPGQGDGGFQLFDHSTPERRRACAVTVGGLLSLGFSGLVVDHSAPVDERRWFMTKHSMMAHLFGVPLFGEAWPYYESERGRVLDTVAIRTMPWVMTATELARRPWAGPVDPDATRLFVIYERGPAQYGEEPEWSALIDGHAARGYRAITSHPGMFARAAEHARSVG